MVVLAGRSRSYFQNIVDTLTPLFGICGTQSTGGKAVPDDATDLVRIVIDTNQFREFARALNLSIGPEDVEEQQRRVESKQTKD